MRQAGGPMSAQGQRTLRLHFRMSALSPKTDID
jgi:hypothetical protein